MWAWLLQLLFLILVKFGRVLWSLISSGFNTTWLRAFSTWGYAFTLIRAIFTKALSQGKIGYTYILFYIESIFLFIQGFFDKDSIKVISPSAQATVKVATATGYIALLLAAVLAYVEAVAAVLNTFSSVIVSTMPPSVVGAWGWIMPPNTTLCIFTIYTAYSARFCFRWYIYVLNAKYKAVVSTDVASKL